MVKYLWRGNTQKSPCRKVDVHDAELFLICFLGSPSPYSSLGGKDYLNQVF